MERLTHWERNGIKIGEKRGREIGEIQGLRKALFSLLKSRFDTVPAWVEEKVERAQPDLLLTWLSAILSKNTLEEIFAA